MTSRTKPYNHIRYAALFALLCILMLPYAAYAWGSEAHQITGAIANHLLKGSGAKRKVHQLLSGMNLETASVWADCVKTINPKEDFVYRVGKRPECAPFETNEGIVAMQDFVRRNDRNYANANGTTLESCHKRYADIPPQQLHYKKGGVGSTDHDIVQAVLASISVLQGKRASAPFDIKDQREALLLLAHFIGDLHQPLHVGAIYLNADGQSITFAHEDIAAHTFGGNVLTLGEHNLHALWDAAPAHLKRGKLRDQLSVRASVIARPSGRPDAWPLSWADQTLQDAGLAYQGVRFSPSSSGARGNFWTATLPSDYDERIA